MLASFSNTSGGVVDESFIDFFFHFNFVIGGGPVSFWEGVRPSEEISSWLRVEVIEDEDGVLVSNLVEF